jgi:YggT family protein
VREILCQLLNVYIIIIIVRIVMSWFPTTPGGVADQVARFTRVATDPVLNPLRRVLPSIGALDLSPIVAILGLQIVVGGLILRCGAF